MRMRFSGAKIGLLLILLCLLYSSLSCGPSEQPGQEAYAQFSRREPAARSNTGNFDYYVLSLSWAPTFCTDPRHEHARECDPRLKAGFVVHGLWPEREDGRSPEYCGSPQLLNRQAMHEGLSLMPDAGLVRHEWRAHGTCSGLSSLEYFELTQNVREKITIPSPYRTPQRELRTSSSTIEQRFAQASHITQHDAIHVRCSGERLAEVRFCFSKRLEPRPCSQTIGECRANPILMGPVR